MPRSWLAWSPAEIDAGVERQHDRALARYERQVDRADAEQAAWEREWEDDPDRYFFLASLPEAAS